MRSRKIVNIKAPINPNPILKSNNDEDKKIVKAINKLAPEDTPNTYGPASGFLNNCCKNKPEVERSMPVEIAVINLGILNS